MPIIANTNPPTINSLGSKIEYILEVTNDNLFTNIYDKTPYGLSVATIYDPTITSTPSVAVGDIIHITDPDSLYVGSHVITDIISSTAYSIDVVFNTFFTVADGSVLTTNCAHFTNLNFTLAEYVSLYDMAIPTKTIAVLTGRIGADNLIRLNITEYLRGYKGSYTDRSFMFNFKETYPLTDGAMVQNSVITTSELTPFFDLFSFNRIVANNCATMVFFKGFKTFLSETLVYLDEGITYEISTTDTTPFTQGSTFTKNKLESQTVEVLDGCMKDALNIVFLNFAGGLSNYVCFNDIAISREFENETRFKDDQLAEYIQSVQSFESYEVSCENVRCTHSQMIEQMIASPLTWLDDTDGNLTPIVIEKNSFLKYKSYDESLNFSFTFRKSETTQSQIN